jgi:nucleotide-binding universal stress UspA family protein
MYRKILVALENSKADASLLPHVVDLAKRLGSELLLLHVADGFVARNFDQLKFAESEEMKADRNYLEDTAKRLQTEGVKAAFRLALGNPPAEILKTAAAEQCDLIAMTSHGHRLIGDIIHGSTIEPVRHKAAVPLLVVPASEMIAATR